MDCGGWSGEMTCTALPRCDIMPAMASEAPSASPSGDRWHVITTFPARSIRRERVFILLLSITVDAIDIYYVAKIVIFPRMRSIRQYVFARSIKTEEYKQKQSEAPQ